jgi:hypothetical protein
MQWWSGGRRDVTGFPTTTKSVRTRIGIGTLNVASPANDDLLVRRGQRANAADHGGVALARREGPSRTRGIRWGGVVGGGYCRLGG